MTTLNETYGTMYYVKDMAKAVAFHKEALGLKLRFESPEWTEFDADGHAICLHALHPGEKRSDDKILIFNVKGIQNAVSDLRSRGVEIADAHEVYPGAYSAEFKTPDGQLLSIYENTNQY
jgi:predicted enzyme related to lactoylglutathione lyase